MRFLAGVMLVVWCMNTRGVLGQVPMQSENWPYTYKHYSDEDGLPQNSVKAITVDHSGFVWLATESGVVRFDGQNFHTYDKSNTDVSHTRFYAIHADLSGVKGRFYALAEFNEFVKIEHATAEADHNYFRNEFSAVPHIFKNSEKVFLATGTPNYWFDLSTPEQYVILSPKGRGWFFVLDAETISFYRDFKKTGELVGKTGLLRNYFSQDGALYRYGDTGEILQFTSQGVSKLALEGDILSDPAYRKYSSDFRFFWNNPTDQSFILLGKNFYYLEKNSRGSFSTRLILNGFDFDAKDIRTVYYDSKLSRVFLGSVTSGLHVFSKKQFQVLRVGNKDMDNIFYGQAVFDSNRVLTPNGVILGLSNAIGKKQPELYRDNREIFKLHLDQDGRSMFRGVRGNLWSKAFDHVYLYDQDGRKALGDWDAGDQVKTIYEDVENDRVWLGLREKGLYFLQHGAKELTNFKVNGFPEIAYLAKAGKNKLWVATLAGLYLADIDSPGAVLINGTKKMNIRSLFPVKGKPETLFFTTYEDGVFLYQDDKLIPFPLDAKGHMASSHCIVEDRSGFFWISSNNGLFQVAKADLMSFAEKWKPGAVKAEKRKVMPELFYMYYSREDGFLTNEFNGGCQPCALQLPNGIVSIPSLNGLVWYRPDQFLPEVPSNSLVLDQVYLQGKPLPLKKGRVELPVNPKQVEIHMALPFFGNRNNIHLSYAMVPKYATVSDSDWISLSAADPVIKFSDVSYGNYSLLVKKFDGFGVDNFSVVSVDVIVPPSWYESWWSKIIAVILLTAGIYAYIQYRVRFLQRRNSELEVQVERRTNRLQETLVALQVSEKELSRQMHLQSRLIASISHDVRTPLRFVVASAERIETFIRERRYEMIGTLSKNIVASGVQMDRFLGNTMAYIKTQVYEKQIHMEKVILLPLIQEKIDFFAAVMKEQNTELVNLVDPALAVESNAQLLGTIIHNVLDNASKYTFEGIITIAAERDGKQLHLIISDTGPGIPEPLVYWLNNGNIQDSPENITSIAGGYNSLGMLIVREISGMINTSVHIENRNGARIHIIFQSGAETANET